MKLMKLSLFFSIVGLFAITVGGCESGGPAYSKDVREFMFWFGSTPGQTNDIAVCRRLSQLEQSVADAKSERGKIMEEGRKAYKTVFLKDPASEDELLFNFKPNFVRVDERINQASKDLEDARRAAAPFFPVCGGR